MQVFKVNSTMKFTLKIHYYEFIYSFFVKHIDKLREIWYTKISQNTQRITRMPAFFHTILLILVDTQRPMGMPRA